MARKLATLTGGYVTIEPRRVVPTNPDWRALIVKGTTAELVALAGIATGMIAICTLDPSNNYPELGDTVDPTKRGALNTWLGANGHSLIGSDWTNAQTISYIMSALFLNNYQFEQYQVAGTVPE